MSPRARDMTSPSKESVNHPFVVQVSVAASSFPSRGR